MAFDYPSVAAIASYLHAELSLRTQHRTSHAPPAVAPLQRQLSSTDKAGTSSGPADQRRALESQVMATVETVLGRTVAVDAPLMDAGDR